MVLGRAPGLIPVELILEGILRREGAGIGGRDLFLSALSPIDFRSLGSSDGVLGIGILRLDPVEGVLSMSLKPLSDSEMDLWIRSGCSRKLKQESFDPALLLVELRRELVGGRFCQEMGGWEDFPGHLRLEESVLHL